MHSNNNCDYTLEMQLQHLERLAIQLQTGIEVLRHQYSQPTPPNIYQGGYPQPAGPFFPGNPAFPQHALQVPGGYGIDPNMFGVPAGYQQPRPQFNQQSQAAPVPNAAPNSGTWSIADQMKARMDANLTVNPLAQPQPMMPTSIDWLMADYRKQNEAYNDWKQPSFPIFTTDDIVSAFKATIYKELHPIRDMLIEIPHGWHVDVEDVNLLNDLHDGNTCVVMSMTSPSLKGSFASKPMLLVKSKYVEKGLGVVIATTVDGLNLSYVLDLVARRLGRGKIPTGAYDPNRVLINRSNTFDWDFSVAAEAYSTPESPAGSWMTEDGIVMGMYLFPMIDVSKMPPLNWQVLNAKKEEETPIAEKAEAVVEGNVHEQPAEDGVYEVVNNPKLVAEIKRACKVTSYKPQCINVVLRSSGIEHATAVMISTEDDEKLVVAFESMPVIMRAIVAHLATEAFGDLIEATPIIDEADSPRYTYEKVYNIIFKKKKK